ncbi:MAG: TldD/PmbA family protein, partial [Planctomycetes bacterium]|nr:TldD/PmbA family protein [Planctomycetota bacterium]
MNEIIDNAKSLFSKFDDIELELISQGVEQIYIRFADNGISQPTSKNTGNLRIRVISGKKQGIANINQFDKKSLHNAIVRAKKLAELSTADESILPLNDNVDNINDSKGFDAETAELSVDTHVGKVEQIIRKGDKLGLKVSGNCISTVRSTAYLNSRGVQAQSKLTSSFASATMQTDNSGGWGYESSNRINVIDAEKIADVAISKALSSKNPKEIPLDELNQLPVILEPAAFAEILLYLTFCGFSAMPYIEGRSFVAGKLGKQFFDEKLNIEENVYNDLLPGMPFDYEGVKKRRINLVESGKVVNLAYDRKTAKKDGAENTGHANPQPDSTGPIPTNLIVAPGDSSIENMIGNSEKAILITKFHYVNLEDFSKVKLTGLTRNGTFLVENG